MKENRKPFDVIMNKDSLYITIRKKYFDLIKENENTLNFAENEKELTLNVNENFDNIDEDNPLYAQIGIFYTVFNYCLNSNLSIKESVNYILNSNLCLSQKIPTYTIEYINNSNIKIKNLELPTEKELNKIASTIQQSTLRTKTIYKCYDNIDIITSCIHYFVSNGHILKTCEHCQKWFITDSRNDQKYCKRQSPHYPKMTCSRAEKYKRSRESKTSEIDKLIKNVRQKEFYNKGLSSQDIELQNFNKDIKQFKENIIKGINTQEDLKQYLLSFYKGKDGRN